MKNYNNHHINKVTHPRHFKLETTSIWSFPDRGSWATHNGNYRGNWSPYIPRNLILRYSNKNDIVLDQFIGGGTTLIETVLLGRKGIGIDINSNAIRLSHHNIGKIAGDFKFRLHEGDARRLDKITDESVDLICTHPPYSNIIKYSESNKNDISRLEVEDFLSAMVDVSQESFRVLRKGRYCAIMMGDIRKSGNIIPLGFKTMECFISSGFILKEIIIKQQHNCRSTKYWKDKSLKYNFFLIEHEYIYVFKKI